MEHRNGTTREYTRVNIYLSDPSLRTRIKIAAAHKGITVSAFCEKAILHMLDEESTPHTEADPTTYAPREAAAELIRLRRETGPIGIPVSELIAEGRRR